MDYELITVRDGQPTCDEVKKITPRTALQRVTKNRRSDTGERST